MTNEEIRHLMKVAHKRRTELHNTVHIGYPEFMNLCKTAMRAANLQEGTTDERMCVCGHDIWEHEDYDFDIHECNHTGCECKQFRDADDNELRPQPCAGKEKP